MIKQEQSDITWEELWNKCTGLLILSIGNGDFKREVYRVMMLANNWAVDNYEKNIVKKKRGVI